jgi:fumarylpyruvate hydrolase
MGAVYLFEPRRPISLGVRFDKAIPIHRIYCVGQNYAAHTREMGGEPGRKPPFFFMKPADALNLKDVVPFPPRTSDLHHEVELVVALHRGGRNIPVDEALDTVYAYAVGVDLTRRDLQAEAKKAGRPWDVAKGFDDSAPVSALVSVKDIGHPSTGRMQLLVNGELRQDGQLADMIWSVPEIIAELSTLYELAPGDLIFTGTPEGVAALQRGDRVECYIDDWARFEFVMGD